MSQTDSVPGRVVVLGTGGTISGKSSSPGDNLGYSAGELGVDDLLAGIGPAKVELTTEQVAQIDSKDMSYAVWRELALRCDHWLRQEEVIGIVVTHGTDTLEETAFFLQQVLAPIKPIVLTCAMRPASSAFADGPQNIRDSIAVACEPGASGVLVACAGTVHSAMDVQKVHTYRLDAFSSGDAGALGFVEEGRLRRVREWPRSSELTKSPCLPSVARTAAAPRVEVLLNHADAGGELIDALLRERAGAASRPVRGLVLAATGNGTLSGPLEEAALRAEAQGVHVLRATRCPEGRIISTGTSRLPDAGALNPVKARIALLLDLLAADAASANS
ncbi:L-asparaginase [Burkholderiales bacterium 8X]|nr:L-asparaginase [Burkholderiales bacterium 8X]